MRSKYNLIALKHKKFQKVNKKHAFLTIWKKSGEKSFKMLLRSSKTQKFAKSCLRNINFLYFLVQNDILEPSNANMLKKSTKNKDFQRF